MSRTRRWHAALAAVMMVVGLAGSASARKPTAQERIESYTVRAQTLQQQDTQGDVTEDLGKLNAWLGEAQAYRAQDEEKKLGRTLDRVDVQVTMIEAILAQERAEDEVAEAKSQANEISQRLSTLRSEAEQLEGRQKQLDQQGRR